MMKSNLPALALWLMAALLSSCMSYKPASTKGPGTAYELFPLGDAGMQYFIKPMRFKAQEGRQLLADITFRHRPPLSGLATVNFTLESREAMSSLSGMAISNGQETLVLQDIRPMFTRVNKQQHRYRYTSTASLPELLGLFVRPDWTWRQNPETNTIRYVATPRTRKVLLTLQRNMAVLD